MIDVQDRVRKLAEDYANCERENQNLRNALAWAAQRLSEADLDALEICLDTTLEDGGVTGTDSEDERQKVVELLVKLITHLEPLLLSPLPESVRQPVWFTRLDILITNAREYGPKHPLMRRVGGHPNVFAPVREKIL